MKQLHLSQSPLVAVVNYAEVAYVAAVVVISFLTIVNDHDDAAVAFISHATLVNDATFALVNVAAVEVVNVAAVAVNNAVAVALITV